MTGVILAISQDGASKAKVLKAGKTEFPDAWPREERAQGISVFVSCKSHVYYLHIP